MVYLNVKLAGFVFSPIRNRHTSCCLVEETLGFNVVAYLFSWVLMMHRPHHLRFECSMGVPHEAYLFWRSLSTIYKGLINLILWWLRSNRVTRLWLRTLPLYYFHSLMIFSRWSIGSLWIAITWRLLSRRLLKKENRLTTVLILLIGFDLLVQCSQLVQKIGGALLGHHTIRADSNLAHQSRPLFHDFLLLHYRYMLPLKEEGLWRLIFFFIVLIVVLTL